MLITSILMGFLPKQYYVADQQVPQYLLSLPMIFLTDVMVVSLLTIFFSILTFALVTTIINEYVIIYMEKQSNDIEPTEVWERVKKDYLMILIASIGYSVVVMVGTVFFVVPGFYLFVTLSLIYIVQITETDRIF